MQKEKETCRKNGRPLIYGLFPHGELAHDFRVLSSATTMRRTNCLSFSFIFINSAAKISTLFQSDKFFSIFFTNIIKKDFQSFFHNNSSSTARSIPRQKIIVTIYLRHVIIGLPAHHLIGDVELDASETAVSGNGEIRGTESIDPSLWLLVYGVIARAVVIISPQISYLHGCTRRAAVRLQSSTPGGCRWHHRCVL